MNLSLIALTLFCVTGIACGQLLFKQAAIASTVASGWEGQLLNGWLWAAFVLYGAMTLLWVWILRHTALNIAYPFMGLAFLIVPLLAWALLGEPLTWQTIVGGGLILVGVALSSWGARG